MKYSDIDGIYQFAEDHTCEFRYWWNGSIPFHGLSCCVSTFWTKYTAAVIHNLNYNLLIAIHQLVTIIDRFEMDLTSSK